MAELVEGLCARPIDISRSRRSWGLRGAVIACARFDMADRFATKPFAVRHHGGSS